MLDDYSEVGYNGSQDDIYDRVADNILSRPQVIKMEEQKAINDSNHEHSLVIDETDTLDGFVAWMCTRDKCGVGFFLPVGQTPK